MPDAGSRRLSGTEASLGVLSDSVKQQVLNAVAALREDTRDEAALGDASKQTRNIAVSDAAWELRDLVLKNRQAGLYAVESGALEAMVMALRQRPNSEAVQWKVSSALGQVLCSPNCLMLAGEAGAVGAVVSALRGHPNSEAVQEHASEAILSLVGGGQHQENQVRAIRAGAVEAIVIALEHHRENEALQRSAAAALAGLVAANRNGQFQARVAHGVEALARTLAKHFESEIVQERAPDALCSLVEGDKENQRLACAAGAVASVVRVLGQHPSNRRIQAKALSALRCLVVDNPDGQRLAGEENALNMTLAALKAFPKEDDVQEQACEAIGHLVLDSKENQRRARERGLLQALIQIVLGRPLVPAALQSSAVRALGRLVAGNAASQTVAGESGAVEVLAAAFRRFGKDAEAAAGGEHVVQELAVAFQGLATGHPANQALARKSGVIESLVSVLRQHPDSADPLQHKASSALRILIVDNHSNTKVAVASGGVEEVIFALKQGIPKKGQAEAPAPAPAPQQRRRSLSPTRQGAGAAALAAAAAADAALATLEAGAAPVEGPKTEKQEYQDRARQAGLIQAIVAALGPLMKNRRPSLASSADGAGADAAGAASPAPAPAPAPAAAAGGAGAASSPARLLGVLADLVDGNFENQDLASGAGAVEAVLGAMRSSPQDSELQEAGVEALLRLLWENASSQRIGKALDAAEALRVAKEANPACQSLREVASKAYKALHSGEKFPERIMETDYGRRHSTCTSITDTAMRGITLEQILDLQEFMRDSLQRNDIVEPVPPGKAGAANPGGSSPSSSSSKVTASAKRSLRFQDLTMYQVRDHFVLPLTKKSNCSFVELVASSKQPPMWMVSHWWGTPFPFTVRMLQLQARSRHLMDASTVSYWCDAFANNQWGVQEFDEGDVLRFPFARAMLSQSCLGTVLLCDPEVTALLRTWCVFEAHVTQQLRCGALADRCDKKYFLDILAPVTRKEGRDKVTITMLQDAIGGSWNEVSDTEGVFFPLGVAHVGVGVDVRNAEASEESDHRMILNFLTQGKACKDPPPTAHPKYDELNNFVHNVFASAELYRVASERPDSCVKAAAQLLQMRADVNSFVRQGQTPLFAAAGADPSGFQKSSSSSSTSKVKHNHATDHQHQRDLVELLLTARADVNHASADMKTVLDCASDLSDDARGLLIQHGAKTFADAAPDLERTANAKIAQILSSGFASEQQAFVGGDAGTRLTPLAQRSLQASASILKLYHWAPCRIGVQTNSSRHQANLAGERAQSIRLALESAGCKNTLLVTCGAQVCLLTLTISITPSGVTGGSLATAPPPPTGAAAAAAAHASAPGLGSSAPRDQAAARLRSLTPARLSGLGRPISPQTIPVHKNPGLRLPPVLVSDTRGGHQAQRWNQAMGATWPSSGGGATDSVRGGGAGGRRNSGCSTSPKSRAPPSLDIAAAEAMSPGAGCGGGGGGGGDFGGLRSQGGFGGGAEAVVEVSSGFTPGGGSRGRGFGQAWALAGGGSGGGSTCSSAAVSPVGTGGGAGGAGGVPALPTRAATATRSFGRAPGAAGEAERFGPSKPGGGLPSMLPAAHGGGGGGGGGGVGGQRSLKGANGHKPQTPPPGSGGSGQSPRRVATDLDALAGDRWFQTSITCSRSAPTLQSPVRAEPVVSEVKSLGSTTPFAGMEHGRGACFVGSYRVATSNGRSGRPKVSDILGVSPKTTRPNGGAGDLFEANPSGHSRPQAACGARPARGQDAVFNGVVGGAGGGADYHMPQASALAGHHSAPAPVAAAEGGGGGGGGMAAAQADGRPPTRAGQRHSRPQAVATGASGGGWFDAVPSAQLSPQYGGGHSVDWASSPDPGGGGMRMSTLPALSQQLENGRRSGSRVFSVTDLVTDLID